MSSTAVTDTTIEESKNKIYVAFKKLFSDIKTEQIHNDYFCQQRNCRHISSQDLAAMSKDSKFQYKQLLDPKYAYCEKTKTLSLVYIDGKDIFHTKQHNCFKTWNNTANIDVALTQLKDTSKVKCKNMHMKLVREETILTLTEKRRKGNDAEKQSLFLSVQSLILDSKRGIFSYQNHLFTAIN